MPVQVIKATKAPITTAARTQKLRVAAYCRVSTDSEEQESSYEAQCRHYNEFINTNPSWTLAGIYADEGISGTSLKNREQFKRMIADCENRQIDMIITKSISRWARNTIDSLKYIRKLKDLDIPVIFEKENVNTLGSGGEVFITILSSLAQQESDSISKNVRMGIQYQMQQGKGRLNTSQFLGLSKSPDGKLVIKPQEAELIRRIYREYLEGYSPANIASRLTAEQIPTPAGKTVWYASTVSSILENEKYCGDLLLQKYYTVDFLTHRIERNLGKLPQYFVEDAHDPIVPKEVYYQVQGEIARRASMRNEPNKFRVGASDALTGRLVCSHCGRTLKRYINPDPALTDWRCRSRAYTKKSIDKEMIGACPCRTVPEREVKRAILTAFNELPSHQPELVRIQEELGLAGYDLELERLQEKSRVITELLDDMDTGDGAERMQSELERIEAERTGLMLERAEAANKDVQIRLLLELIDMLTSSAGEDGKDVDNHSGDNHTNEAGGVSGACVDYDDFFRRTSYNMNTEVIDGCGKIIAFNNDLIVRYLDRVVVEDELYRVQFKAGLEISVGINPM